MWKLLKNVQSSTQIRRPSVQVRRPIISTKLFLTSFSEYAEEQASVIEKVTKARALLPEVEVPMEIRLKISQVRIQNFLYTFLTEEARCVRSLMLMVCAVTLLQHVPLAPLLLIGAYEPKSVSSWLTYVKIMQWFQSCYRWGCVFRHFALPPTSTQKGPDGHYRRRFASLRGLLVGFRLRNWIKLWREQSWVSTF